VHAVEENLKAIGTREEEGLDKVKVENGLEQLDGVFDGINDLSFTRAVCERPDLTEVDKGLISGLVQ
jgi:hypothetical protein